MDDPAPSPDTNSPAYAQRLDHALDRRGWRRLIDPQIPYRWNVRRLGLGRVLDVGCGVGRNLAHLGGDGVGIDHNPAAVASARARGLQAFTPDEFATSPVAVVGAFDSLLCAHVLEHLTESAAHDLLAEYLPYVRDGGKIVLICPQQRGQQSDPTHVTFFDAASLRTLAEAVDIEVESQRSFPFPSRAGTWFTHNETMLIARRR
jgi:SAM-dependent methyltransferase